MYCLLSDRSTFRQSVDRIDRLCMLWLQRRYLLAGNVQHRSTSSAGRRYGYVCTYGACRGFGMFLRPYRSRTGGKCFWRRLEGRVIAGIDIPSCDAVRHFLRSLIDSSTASSLVTRIRELFGGNESDIYSNFKSITRLYRYSKGF